MGPPDSSGACSPEGELPLLGGDIVDGAVDYKDRPARRSCSGGWRSAAFIIGVEVAERFAYYGISANLITYLTGPLGESTATAAENVNLWSGTASLLPLLGAFVADSYLGRYRTIIIASLVYILGLALLTLSAVLTSLGTSECQNTTRITSCSFSKLHAILFFFSLYMVAAGQAGHKPCVQAFGADQFDEQDPVESKAKSSFFNWWYFGLCAGATVTFVVIVYIQDNLNWSLGFGIPCIIMVVALVIFLMGTRTYRFSNRSNGRSPFIRIGHVYVAAAKNWRKIAPLLPSEEEALELTPENYKQFEFLNKALIIADDSKENQTSADDVEEAKSILRLVPIWLTSLVFAIVYAQTSTFFTKQGATMDRTIFPGFEIPAASLQVFTGLAIVITIPIYDRVFVPIARSLTNKPSGITMLQRIGAGMFLSILGMVTAALVETKRLEIAREYGLVDIPNATIPMSVWWLVPQYVLFGLAEALTMVGLQEFFYDQVPSELRSVGMSLYLSVIGVGSILSSILISIIEAVTGSDGWFSNNLNKAHLNYFYWLLAGIGVVGLALFFCCAMTYIYRRRAT
ncbi:protein NRT1/ PTR FAMILY 5.10-like [Rhodamnia argentea]|uniref:Protein NRT1/ PTR FAMILY 5.10-like n=1 Tax=Rhodamnia argentea TaxID=178133 RepID=A0A8B8NRX3_9MYRT|nr:protein NRT1/ PTR FAMILY 5.10-like [Rhodamnia argentea]